MKLKQFFPMLAFASLALAGCGGSVSKTGIELSNLDQKRSREIILSVCLRRLDQGSSTHGRVLDLREL